MNAILIIAHKNYKQLERLIYRCQSSDTKIFLHIDAKASFSQEELLRLHSLPNVYLTNERIAGILDSRTLVDITMILISRAHEVESESNIHFKYYILLSGQDYLTKSISYINKYLENSYPEPFIDCTPYSADNWISRKFRTTLFLYPSIFKVKEKYPDNRHPVRRLERAVRGTAELIASYLKIDNYHKLLKKGYEIYGGSAWWILPDIAIQHIETAYNQLPPELKYLLYSYTPEETFFQTLAMRSPIRNMISLNAPKYVGQNCKTWAYFFDDEKPPVNHPYTFTTAEYDKLINRGCWFARKFDMNIDSEIFNLLDQYCDNKYL